MSDSSKQLEAPWGPGLPPGRPGVDWKIRVAAAVWAPSSFPCLLDLKQVDGDPVNCPYPGFSADILHLALKYAEMEYELIPFPIVESWGNIVGKNNDTWILDGLLGMIQNGTLDFVMSYYGMADTLLEAMDFTFPYEFNQMRYGYVMQKQSSAALSSATLLYAMFSWKVWLSFTGVLVFLVFMLFVTRNFKLWWKKKEKFNHHHQVQEDAKKIDCSALWDVISLFLEQHHGPPSEGSLSGNFVLLIFGFTCLFLHTMYEGYLVTQMFKQGRTKPFSGLSQLAPLIQDGTYQLITYGLDDAIFTMINHGEGEQFEAMRKAMAAHPPIVNPDINQVMEALTKDPRLVYPGAFEISVYSQMRDKCSLMFVDDEDIPIMWISNPYQKHSRVGSMVSAAMAGMVDYMLYIGDKYTAREQSGDKCIGIDNLQEGKNALALKHYYGLLIVGAFGMGAAFLILLLEIAVAKWSKDKTKNTLSSSISHNALSNYERFKKSQ